MVKYCSRSKTQGRENNPAQESGFSSDAPKKKHFYALKFRFDQADSPMLVPLCCKYFQLFVEQG